MESLGWLPVEKVIPAPVPFENLRFLWVLRTQNSIVRFRKQFIHSLLARLLQFTQPLRQRFPAV